MQKFKFIYTKKIICFFIIAAILTLSLALPDLVLFRSAFQDFTECISIPSYSLSEICFFGDSTTFGLLKYNVNNNGTHGANYHTLNTSQIIVPPEGTFYLGNVSTARINLADGRCLPLSEAIAAINPHCLIVTVGINGMRTWNEENFGKYYRRLVEIFRYSSPRTTVILQSVYPTSREISGALSDFTNDKINSVNNWIRNIADEYGLKYLNTCEVLKDSEGYLKSEYQNGDGMHLNTHGFNAILRYIDSNINTLDTGEMIER